MQLPFHLHPTPTSYKPSTTSILFLPTLFSFTISVMIVLTHLPPPYPWYWHRGCRRFGRRFWECGSGNDIGVVLCWCGHCWCDHQWVQLPHCWYQHWLVCCCQCSLGGNLCGYGFSLIVILCIIMSNSTLFQGRSILSHHHLLLRNNKKLSTWNKFTTPRWFHQREWSTRLEWIP